ncbi:phytanoyl-CoA dioxygenase family protein [Phenylobacterium sp.]|uniref:phytanoyl-CoA dioxygenase family protein n=1 Tax=Phenylobacterium sp. TaxID=1871053 RepID=UPI002DEB1EBB|nr:phytanoyl-CoA dioxygenase family protein [Phenylobacterium sp.]
MAATAATLWTDAARERFETRGLVRFEAALPRRAAEAMADRLWADLERREGVRREDPATWTTERIFGFQAVQASGAFDGMAAPAVRRLLDDLMGQGRWAEPAHWGQPITCFPTPGPWALPHRNWHLDGPGEPASRRAMVARLFLILGPLAPQGGGTVVATGSHRIVEAIADEAGETVRSGDMRQRLAARYPWIAELTSRSDREDRTQRFMDRETTVAGVAVQVEEMTGEPGDLYLMHPRALHAGAPNATDQPRLVLSQFVTPKG